MHFEGTVQADGVDASIVKQKVDTTRKGASSDRRRMETTDDSFVYFETLSTAELLKNKDKCVLILVMVTFHIVCTK
ncbi:hypothetical protein BCV71DRAFT_185130 [Rhizopus microsporus]|uniref:Uncharacterized protein n=1 Tax=Rhizopus microsporus TaxID=58291 RepID=A0A1X0RUI6_RHIZD|nr:hypothetical protein BCV71DRAFT_185130 [Rhizopus microsporus]